MHENDISAALGCNSKTFRNFHQIQRLFKEFKEFKDIGHPETSLLKRKKVYYKSSQL